MTIQENIFRLDLPLITSILKTFFSKIMPNFCQHVIHRIHKTGIWASYMNNSLRYVASTLRQRTVKNARVRKNASSNHFIHIIIQWVDKVPIKMTLSSTTKLLLLLVLASSVFSRPQENRRQGKVLVGKLHIFTYDRYLSL